jgi:hypothetical protein
MSDDPTGPSARRQVPDEQCELQTVSQCRSDHQNVDDNRQLV